MSTYTGFDPENPPPPLMTGEPNSFAYTTMTTRKPQMLKDVLADHTDFYPAAVVQQVRSLYRELVENQPLQPVETLAPDAAMWRRDWRPHRGKRWLEIPWYFAEAFLYRRLIEAVGFFNDNARGGLDPFLPRKREELNGEAAWAVLASALQQAPDNTPAGLRVLLHYGVWGNRLDLSYMQVAQSAGREISLEQEAENLLVDDTEAVVMHLQQIAASEQSPGSAGRRSGGEGSEGGGGVHFICDNAGTELLTDLALADFLLKFKWTAQVTLHVKAHPTYVSDATLADVNLTLATMQTQSNPDFSTLAMRLRRYRRQHRLRIRPDFFWNSSRFFWELSPALETELAQAELVIIKGDANYRRLLGDSRWPATVSMVEAAPYFPAPFVALRTLKSDPIVGLQPDQAEALDQQDVAWRVNGQRGLIQTVLSRPPTTDR